MFVNNLRQCKLVNVVDAHNLLMLGPIKINETEKCLTAPCL